MPDKDKLIERVARAIYERHWSVLPEASRPAWPGDTGPDVWMFYAEAALSAIEQAGLVIVPRKPSEAMIDAASLEPMPEEYWHATILEQGRLAAKAHYIAMISTALTENRVEQDV